MNLGVFSTAAGRTFVSVCSIEAYVRKAGR